MSCDTVLLPHELSDLASQPCQLSTKEHVREVPIPTGRPEMGQLEGQDQPLFTLRKHSVICTESPQVPLPENLENENHVIDT